MKKTITYILLLTISIGLTSFGRINKPKNTKNTAESFLLANDCSYKGKKLYGKIQFVTSHPDIKIQYVTTNADIDVQMVSSSPNSCGKWQEVSSSADLKIQIVNSFPDLKVRLVKSNPGMK